VGEAQGWLPPVSNLSFLGTLRGGRYLVSELFTLHLMSLAVPLGLLLLFLLFRLILRLQWLAVVAFSALGGLTNAVNFLVIAPPSAGTVAPVLFGAAMGAISWGILVLLLVRFGLLATAAASLCGMVLDAYAVSLDFSTPYAAASLFGMLVIAAYAIYAFRISLAGRAVFEDKLLQQ
jgi:hypothetical protein